MFKIGKPSADTDKPTHFWLETEDGFVIDLKAQKDGIVVTVLRIIKHGLSIAGCCEGIGFKTKEGGYIHII